MFFSIRNLFVILIAYGVMDFIWLKLVAGSFFLEALKSIARVKDGAFDVYMPAALLAYLVMSLAVDFFIFDGVHNKNLSTTLISGAFLGFVMFAVFDFTNWAFLRDYPLRMVLADISWGTFMTAVVSAVTYKAQSLF